MKRLCLLRHAKSDWSDPSSNDFDRPINARGAKTADFMAQYIAQCRYRPDYVLCSSARRATQTCTPLVAKLGASAPVEYRDILYHAMPDILLSEIQGAPDKATTLLIVAHNPGVVLLAMALSRDPDDDISMRVAHGVPTGGFIVIEFPDAEHWSEISEGEGNIVFFGCPRDLMSEGLS